MAGTLNPLSNHADSIIQRIAKGEYLKDVAADYGVQRQAITIMLKRLDPEQYKLLMREGTDHRLEQSLAEIDAAKDNVAVARAGTKWRAVSWLAERTQPEVYGAKQEVTHRGIETVIVNRRAAVTIDQQAQQGGGTLSDAGVPSREPDRYGITPVESVESADE